MNTPRRIAHVDMDAFFASVELLKFPMLKGQAVAIGGGAEHRPVQNDQGQWSFSRLENYVGRGVLTTSTYEARSLGVHAGMPTMKAAKLAPQVILLPLDFEAYRWQSKRFKEALRSIAPVMEDRGIDEVFLDLSDFQEESHALALRLQTAVHKATGLTCSVGVAPNKLTAKLASDVNKPAGITIWTEADLLTVLGPMHVKKVNGIGPKAVATLAGLGIETLGQLLQADPAALQDAFGVVYARWLVQVSHGQGDTTVRTHQEPKSLSRETTFARDLDVLADREELKNILLELVARLASDLRARRCLTRSVAIKLRFEDFAVVTREVCLPGVTQDADVLLRYARLALRKVSFDRRLRLMGLRAGQLQRWPSEGQAGEPVQMSLELRSSESSGSAPDTTRLG